MMFRFPGLGFLLTVVEFCAGLFIALIMLLMCFYRPMFNLILWPMVLGLGWYVRRVAQDADRGVRGRAWCRRCGRRGVRLADGSWVHTRTGKAHCD